MRYGRDRDREKDGKQARIGGEAGRGERQTAMCQVAGRGPFVSVDAGTLFVYYSGRYPLFYGLVCLFAVCASVRMSAFLSFI